MNVLLLSQFFFTTKGGGEYVFSLMAKKLAEYNNKIWIITNNVVGEKYVDKKNIKIITVPPNLTYEGELPTGFADNIRYSFNAIKTGFKIIKKENIDIIQSNNISAAIAGSILSSLTSRPHITTVHDVFSLCGKDYWKIWGRQSNISKLNVILAPHFEKLLIKLNHECIHTVSNTTKDDLIEFGEKKPIYVIPNSIESNTLTEKKIDPFQFVYVGRLVFYKNLEVIIRAIKNARKTEPRIKLVIVGGGPHKKNLENLADNLDLKTNVKFRGYVTTDEKTELIATSNALLFPSLCEGFGIVILEAFSQNKPVMVSDIRPMSDIVSHGDTGFVLDPYDEDVWAEHILKLIKNPQESETMGMNGNELLKTKYNPEIMFEKILKMYNDVLSKR